MGSCKSPSRVMIPVRNGFLEQIVQSPFSCSGLVARQTQQYSAIVLDRYKLQDIQSGPAEPHSS